MVDKFEQEAESPQVCKSVWRKIVAKYETPKIHRSIWQLTNTLIPFFTLWWLMYLSLGVSYWLTLLLAVPAAGLLIRTFIISHDCGHGSFFKNRRANRFWGTVTGVLSLVPYAYWRREHAQHHATSGDLDRRGVGDIWTLTITEYMARPFWSRMKYRMYRNPVVMFMIGPIFIFLVNYRLAEKKDTPADKRSVWETNLILVTVITLVSWLFGLKEFLLIQAPVAYMASAAGVWLFYVQHQFEGVYWERSEEWSFFTQAIHGSSYYRLPRILQWFTGNIGFHHVHHLSPRIPNYLLEKCHKDNEIFRRVNEIGLRASLKSLQFKLWDEKANRLVSFRELRELLREQSPMA